MTEKQMKDRTKAFAVRVIKLAGALPRTIEADVLRRQVVRSGTGVASAYRAACRARSTDDFAYKLGLVEEEADETALWLEVIVDAEMLSSNRVKALWKEASEICAMMVASLKTTRGDRSGEDPKPKSQNPK